MNKEIEYSVTGIWITVNKRELNYNFGLGSPYIVYRYGDEYRREKSITYGRWLKAKRKHKARTRIKEGN